MTTKPLKITKKITTALMTSLSAGVTPRIGLEHIAVGREAEISVLLADLDGAVADGGASFRIISGRYGSGKSFLCQLIRNYALQRNFVVMDADLSPTHRLTGSNGQGLNLYRELLKNMATKTRPDGSAFTAILERWISDLQKKVVDQDGLKPTDAKFSRAVEKRIEAAIDEIEEMIHGFDFKMVISAYWRGYQEANDTLKEAAIRWLRGEYSTKREAGAALGVKVIIEDDSWYDYLKLLARFVNDIGYKGLVVFIDEAVNLYKISNSVARNNNYERLLTIFNDTMQGKAKYLGIIFGATPQMIEDTRRGLFSYEALQTRLQESRFVRDGLRDLSSPLIRLEVLQPTELFVLLSNIRDIHAQNYGYQTMISDKNIEQFLREVHKRLGADQLMTPREAVRDFISILNLIQQNAHVTFENIIGGSNFVPSRPDADPESLTPETEIIDEDRPASPYKSFDI